MISRVLIPALLTIGLFYWMGCNDPEDIIEFSLAYCVWLWLCYGTTSEDKKR